MGILCRAFEKDACTCKKAFDFIHVLSKANTGQQGHFVAEEVEKAYTD